MRDVWTTYRFLFSILGAEEEDGFGSNEGVVDGAGVAVGSGGNDDDIGGCVDDSDCSQLSLECFQEVCWLGIRTN